MASSTTRNVTTGVIIALVLGALALALFRPTSVTTVQQGQVGEIDDATAETALVVAITEEGGFRFLGITFSSPTHYAQVSFTAPGECSEALAEAETWPTGNSGCGPDGGLAGDIFGGGRTADGRAIVSVRFEIEESCFEVLQVGDVWGRTGKPECPTY